MALEPGRAGLAEKDHARVLERIEDTVTRFMRPHPYLHGSRTVLGVMPDWNPAEIIGIRPRPLALSSETKRLGYMRDPFVFIRAIEAGTSEDSFIAVPKIYEGANSFAPTPSISILTSP